MQKETSGEFTINGKKFNPKQRIKDTYLVMQDSDYQLFTESVTKEVYLGSKPDKNLESKGRDILEKMGLSPYVKHHPASLSGGQKQKLCIAVSYMKDANIICFDEPTSGLDFASMQRVKGLFQSMADDGKAILVISHDYEFVLSVCTSILSVQDNHVKEVFSLCERTKGKLIKAMQIWDTIRN